MAKEVREGQARSEESIKRLETLYQGSYTQRIPDRKDDAEKEAKKDKLYHAKDVVEKTMAAFLILSEDRNLSPAEMIFAMELLALNVLNAQNCPLTPEQINKVRAKALKYYEESLLKLP